MLPESAQRILQRLAPDNLVLDVGGWAEPFPRADWVLDLEPYATRGLYGAAADPALERFTAQTWVQRDVCAREPWPFADDQFDFAVCSHTLEDIRDPVWVCSELSRVARAGYVEVPSRLEEQSRGVHGPWVGWSHHRWLIETTPEGGLEFVFKAHVIHTRASDSFPPELRARLTPAQRVLALFWRGELPAHERIFLDAPGLDAYLADYVAAHRGPPPAPPDLRTRLEARLRRRNRRPSRRN